MSLHPEPVGEIPEETVHVANAAFPGGNILIEDARRTRHLISG